MILIRAHYEGRQSGRPHFRNAVWLLRFLLAILLTPVSILCAQSITVTPSGYVTCGLGGSTQFSASVNGLSNTAVYWSAGGVKGGNSVSGTISTTGLYTAPSTMPGQNPVIITATSSDRSTVSGSTYIYLLNAGPKLTAVSPNPLSTGAITVTLTGSGFIAPVTVVEVYGSTTVQLPTSSVGSNSITASGWQGSAPSASFTVTNPGSVPSNAVVVPIGSPPANYTLKVSTLR